MPYSLKPFIILFCSVELHVHRINGSCSKAEQIITYCSLECPSLAVLRYQHRHKTEETSSLQTAVEAQPLCPVPLASTLDCERPHS